MGRQKKSRLEYISCNLCNSDSTALFMRVCGFNIVKCKKCSLIYINPRLKFNQLKSIYNNTYFKNRAFKDFKYALYGYENYLSEKKDIIDTFARRLRIIERYKKPGKLLDIGCALGFFLELASKRGWKSYGIEVSKAAADYAKKNKHSVFNGTLEEASYKKESFDAVTIFDVIEHLPNPKKTVLQIKKLLKPKGIIAVTTPNIGSLAAKVLGSGWEEIKRVREHTYFFSDKTLRELLESAGFKVLKTETAGRHFSVESAIRRLNIYSPALSGICKRIAKILGLKNVKVYVDPHYKTTMYARKLK